MSIKKLIKNYLRDHDILEAHKTKIDMLKEERYNLLEKKKIDFSSLNIILFLREIMLSLKRWKVVSPLHLWMRCFTLELKCLTKYLINAKPMFTKEVWHILIKMKLPLVEKKFLYKEKKKLLIKQHLLALHHYVHTVTKLDALRISATLSS